MAQEENKQDNNSKTAPVIARLPGDMPASHNMPISARFDKYRSSYWAAKLAAFGARYPLRSMAKEFSETQDLNKPFGLAKKHGYSAAVGTMMGSVTAFFALRTWKDMRNIFAEALAWEFNKDPKDIGFGDFWKSQNSVVQQTMSNYMQYNMRRVAIDVAFFLPLLVLPAAKKLNLVSKESHWHPDKWAFEAGADWGLGANAAYLFSDVISRKMTPFEALQALIDLKINHADHVDAKMTANDLLDVYERHAANGAIASFLSQRNTPQWEQSLKIFERMADLMNQTYKNTPAHEKADFGISKFIYLVGNNLIQPGKVEQTLDYIEVANRYGMDALKEVAKNVKGGASLADALKSYPLETPQAAPSHQAPAAPQKTSELPHGIIARLPSHSAQIAADKLAMEASKGRGGAAA